MSNQQVLSDVVREWAILEVPGQPGAAERAAAIAVAAYVGGASVDEACLCAVDFVGSWVRHPSHWRAERNDLVALAS